MNGSSGSDDWSLRKNLELCGAVLPPVYADVHTDAHLNTFDVNESGNAVLFSDTGRLYVLNLLQVAKKPQASAPKQQQAPIASHSLAHVTLDPPLPPAEVKQVEQVKVNASGSHVLLIARSWVKVVRLPADLSDALSRANAVSQQTQPQAFKKTPASPSLLFAHNRRVERFSVHFADGASTEVTLDAAASSSSASQSDLERVQQALSAQQPSKRHAPVAWISRDVGAATVRQVGYFGAVRQAAWHPLSDAHVVVLSDAEELTVFHTVHDVSKPEQRHVLDFPSKARVASGSGTGPAATSTAFAFGSPTRLWDVFTVYVLRSDGSVFALCPLVPFDCRVRRSVVTALRTEVDAHLALCKRKLEDAAAASALVGVTTSSTKSAAVSEHHALLAQIAELKSQKYWLDESWTRDDSGDRPTTDAEMVRCVKPHISGISPETWPLALQGSVEVTPKSVIEGKHNVRGGSAANALLVVPCPAPRSSDKRVNMAPFLVRSYTSGHVELVLLDAPIRPQWQSGRASGAGRKLPALLLECLNLGIDDSGGKAVLERDVADPRLLYCLHSTGVHVINVSWVFALAGGKHFDALPKSSARHIFSVSPGAGPSTPSSSSSATVSNIVGARVVKNVFFGHLLLLRLASGAFEVVNVSAASSELLKGVLDSSDASAADDALAAKPFPKLPGALAPIASSTKTRSAPGASSTGVAAAVRPFADIVEERVDALAARGTRVTGQTLLSEVDDAVLAFVIERIKILLEDVAYIDEMDTLMRDRLRLHAEMRATQSEKVIAVAQSISAATASLSAVQDKMARALAVQQNLRKRAAAVLQAVKENQPTLSRAERELKTELEHMSIEVRRMKPRVAQLTVSGQRMVRSLETSSASTASSSSRHHALLSASVSAGGLSDEKKRMCFDVLRAETQLIDDTKALIEDMTASLQRLKT